MYACNSRKHHCHLSGYDMAPDRKSSSKGKGVQRDFERGAESHAERAAQLLAKARALPPRLSSDPPPSKSDAVPLPALIKSLADPRLGSDAMSIKEAIPVAGKLARAKLNTPDKLSLLNSILLEEAGVSSEGERHKILVAFGVRRVGSSKEGEKGKAKGALDALSSKVSVSACVVAGR